MTLPMLQGAVSSPSQTGGGGSPSPSDNIISDLFTNNVEGVWYDPSDLSTLFQDYNGTPAVLEGPVRLMLDKSKGLQLGPERLTNGNFSSSSNWTNGIPTSQVGSAIIQNNKLLIDNPPQSQGSFSYVAFQSLSANNKALEPCKVYKLTGTISDYVRGGLGFHIQNDLQNWQIGAPKNLINGLQGNGNFTCYFTTTKTTGYQDQPLNSQPVLNYFQIITLGGGKFSLSNLSLKEVYGNHAFCLPWESDYNQSPTFYAPILRARVNLLTQTDSWAVGTKQQIFLGSIEFQGQNTKAKVTGRKPLRLYFTGTGTVKVSFVGSTDTFTYSSGTNTITIPSNVTDVIVESLTGTVNTIDLRYGTYGNNLSQYQKVTSATNYETSGFPYYLQFGTDYVNYTSTSKSCLVTNMKLFTNSQNKVTCWSGQMQTQNTGNGLIYKLFINPPTISYPTYTFYRPAFLCYVYDVVNGYGFQAFGARINSQYGFAYSTVNLTGFPLTNVVSFELNFLDQTSNTMRIRCDNIPNTVTTQVNDPTVYQGPLNAETPLILGSAYVDAQGLPGYEFFQGKLYSLIIRGTESTATEISNIGQWVSNKMGGGFWT